MTHKLQKGGRDAFEHPSVCYILRNERYDKGFVYTIVSKFFEKNYPQECYIVDNRKVSVKAVSYKTMEYPIMSGGQNVSPSHYWDTTKAKILEDVVKESGFFNVSVWLDNWKDRKDNFEFDKEYEVWLIKVLYPHTNMGIPVLNGANNPTPS